MNASDKRTEQNDPSILETLPASNLKRCVVCGRKLPVANPLDSCPVCLLRLALAEGPIRHSFSLVRRAEITLQDYLGPEKIAFYLDASATSLS
jgi:hypothetical protein